MITAVARDFCRQEYPFIEFWTVLDSLTGEETASGDDGTAQPPSDIDE